ncbi:MAG: hypothetical protein ACREX9_05260 [Gammaproteobacteria bacterium]
MAVVLFMVKNFLWRQPDLFLRKLRAAYRWSEADRIADLTTEIMDKTGAFVHAMPSRAGSYRDRTPLMHEIRREGLDL